jgi:DNA invertase Pin-like site-specific DNA recombinase
MIFGYARVSTDAQDLTAQLMDLKAAGCERVFKEKVERPPNGHGLKNFWRPWIMATW